MRLMSLKDEERGRAEGLSLSCKEQRPDELTRRLIDLEKSHGNDVIDYTTLYYHVFYNHLQNFDHSIIQCQLLPLISRCVELGSPLEKECALLILAKLPKDDVFDEFRQKIRHKILFHWWMKRPERAGHIAAARAAIHSNYIQELQQKARGREVQQELIDIALAGEDPAGFEDYMILLMSLKDEELGRAEGLLLSWKEERTDQLARRLFDLAEKSHNDDDIEHTILLVNYVLDTLADLDDLIIQQELYPFLFRCVEFGFQMEREYALLMFAKLPQDEVFDALGQTIKLKILFNWPPKRPEPAATLAAVYNNFVQELQQKAGSEVQQDLMDISLADEVSAGFENLMMQLMSLKDEERSKAEGLLLSCKEQRPDQLVRTLIDLDQSHGNDVIEYTILFSYVFNTLGDLGYSIIRRDLLPFMFRFVELGSAMKKDYALLMFSQLPQDDVFDESRQKMKLKILLYWWLKRPEPAVRIAEAHSNCVQELQQKAGDEVQKDLIALAGEVPAAFEDLMMQLIMSLKDEERGRAEEVLLSCKEQRPNQLARRLIDLEKSHGNDVIEYTILFSYVFDTLRNLGYSIIQGELLPYVFRCVEFGSQMEREYALLLLAKLPLVDVFDEWRQMIKLKIMFHWCLKQPEPAVRIAAARATANSNFVQELQKAGDEVRRDLIDVALGKDPEPFEDLLMQLMSLQDEERGRAERLLNSCKEQRPDELAHTLIDIFKSHRNDITECTFGGELFKKLCDTLADLDDSIIQLELLPYMFRCVELGSAAEKEYALLMFAQLPQNIVFGEYRQTNKLTTLLRWCLKRPEPGVRIAAARAAANSNFVQELLPQMLEMINLNEEKTIENTLEIFIGLADTKPLLLVLSGDEFGSENVVGSILQIICESVREGIGAQRIRQSARKFRKRRLAMKFIVTLVNKLPDIEKSLYREVVDVINQIFEMLGTDVHIAALIATTYFAYGQPYVMKALTERCLRAAEESLREAIRTAKMMRSTPILQLIERLFFILMELLIQEVGSCSSNDVNQLCFYRLAVSVGENTIMPLAFKFIPFYLVLSDWSKHRAIHVPHAVAIALTEIARGSFEVNMDLQPVVSMLLNPVAHRYQLSKVSVPDVRIAAIILTTYYLYDQTLTMWTVAKECLRTMDTIRRNEQDYERPICLFSRRLLSGLMRLLLDIDDDPAWRVDNADDEVNGLSSSYKLGRHCLFLIAQNRGRNKYFVNSFSDICPIYLADPDWRRPHAALITFAQFAEDCGEEMVRILDPVNLGSYSFRILNVRVQWAILKLISQLITKQHSDLRQQYFQRVRPVLIGAMNDASDTEIQAIAASLILDITQNCTRDILKLYLIDASYNLTNLWHDRNPMVQDDALTALIARSEKEGLLWCWLYTDGADWRYTTSSSD